MRQRLQIGRRVFFFPICLMISGHQWMRLLDLQHWLQVILMTKKGFRIIWAKFFLPVSICFHWSMIYWIWAGLRAERSIWKKQKSVCRMCFMIWRRSSVGKSMRSSWNFIWMSWMLQMKMFTVTRLGWTRCCWIFCLMRLSLLRQAEPFLSVSDSTREK